MQIVVTNEDQDASLFNDMQRAGRLKSALQEYSQVYDEIQKEKLNSHNVARQILEPKTQIINGILSQHLL